MIHGAHPAAGYWVVTRSVRAPKRKARVDRSETHPRQAAFLGHVKKDMGGEIQDISRQ